MKTVVEFRSSKFPPYEEDDEINPGLWGRRLAEFLSKKLEERGIHILDIIAEDWGYYLPIQNEGFKLALCCGHQSGTDDQFIIFTEPRKPKIKKLFRTIDVTAQLTQLVTALNDILVNDSDIIDLTWQAP